MYSPSVVQANDGTWRALWSVGESFPQFAVAYSEDLVTWRPQDYPIVAEKGVKSPVAYQMDDGNFDIYIKPTRTLPYSTRLMMTNPLKLFANQTSLKCHDAILW